MKLHAAALRRADRTARVRSAAIVALTLPWYENAGGTAQRLGHVRAGGRADHVAALGALALVVTTVTERTPALPVAAAVWSTLFGLIAAIAAIVRVLERPHGATSLCAGTWLALAGASLILAGAWQSMRDERTSRLPAAPRPSRANAAALECAVVIDRDEVLHVARLARLQLTRMRSSRWRASSRPCSTTSRRSASSTSTGPADHARRRGDRRLRADEPRASLPREVVLAQAPAVSDDGFPVPSPQA